MAITKGVNSHADLNSANTYFADRIDSGIWSNTPDLEKEKALVTATALLDDMSWRGVAIGETTFPREGDYFEPRLGKTVNFTSETPSRVHNATCELAYHLLANDELIAETGGVGKLEISGIKLEGISNAPLIPSSVRKLLKPLLLTNARTVWRAN